MRTMADIASPDYEVIQFLCSETTSTDSGLQETMHALAAKKMSLRLPDEVFERVSDVERSQGVLAVVRRENSSPDLRDMKGPLLWCDGITDPGNLGTLIRSACGARFEAVLAGEGSTDFFNPKTVRASMGTFAAVRMLDVTENDLKTLLAAGYVLAAASAGVGEDAFETVLPLRTILAVGNEARGLSPLVESLAQRHVSIPLAGACESLNAAVAGSILMFALAHRWQKEYLNGG